MPQHDLFVKSLPEHRWSYAVPKIVIRKKRKWKPKRTWEPKD